VYIYIWSYGATAADEVSECTGSTEGGEPGALAVSALRYPLNIVKPVKERTGHPAEFRPAV
jgi:hypothetical protein